MQNFSKKRNTQDPHEIRLQSPKLTAYQGSEENAT